MGSARKRKRRQQVHNVQNIKLVDRVFFFLFWGGGGGVCGRAKVVGEEMGKLGGCGAGGERGGGGADGGSTAEAAGARGQGGGGGGGIRWRKKSICACGTGKI